MNINEAANYMTTQSTSIEVNSQDNNNLKCAQKKTARIGKVFDLIKWVILPESENSSLRCQSRLANIAKSLFWIVAAISMSFLIAQLN